MASTCFRLAWCQVREWVPRRIFTGAYTTGRRPAPRIVFLSTFVAFCGDKENQKTSHIERKLKDPDPSTLTTEYLLRNASLTSLDSTIKLLSVTTVALSDVEKEYARWTFVLVKFMKFRLTVLGKPEEEERVFDMILQTRSKLTELKERRRDLTLLYQTVTTMVSAAAEAALISGVGYQVSSANEAMQSSQVYLRGVQETSLEAEKEMTDIQVETIEKESKHAEEKEKQNKQKDQQEGEKSVTPKSCDGEKTTGRDENQGRQLPKSSDGEKTTGRDENHGRQDVVFADIKMDDLDRLNREHYVSFVDVEENNCNDSNESDNIFKENVKVDADDKMTEKEIFEEEIKKDKYDPDQWKEC
ncbi:uncharacterized protein LOC132552261 [Ylistrum balloti]|uniref:uncharacterized protein LOC132552261 n=1 Tax=Ylistrum balloti TaxID=509963 RepID=UPI002905989B|nr:uncharacterized protein LOC132552261 [Ylistrum balloti]